jgi:hypothetical protein
MDQDEINALIKRQQKEATAGCIKAGIIGGLILVPRAHLSGMYERDGALKPLQIRTLLHVDLECR